MARSTGFSPAASGPRHLEAAVTLAGQHEDALAAGNHEVQPSVAIQIASLDRGGRASDSGRRRVVRWRPVERRGRGWRKRGGQMRGGSVKTGTTHLTGMPGGGLPHLFSVNRPDRYLWMTLDSSVWQGMPSSRARACARYEVTSGVPTGRRFEPFTNRPTAADGRRRTPLARSCPGPSGARPSPRSPTGTGVPLP